MLYYAFDSFSSWPWLLALSALTGNRGYGRLDARVLCVIFLVALIISVIVRALGGKNRFESVSVF